MEHERRQANYRAYLLRCRRSGTGTDGAGGWRCSLEEPHTGRRRTFGNVREMLDTLHRELEGSAHGAVVPPPATETSHVTNGESSNA